MQRINYAGSDKTELTIEPTYTISVTHKTMDESEDVYKRQASRRGRRRHAAP